MVDNNSILTSEPFYRRIQFFVDFYCSLQKLINEFKNFKLLSSIQTVNQFFDKDNGSLGKTYLKVKS